MPPATRAPKSRPPSATSRIPAWWRRSSKRWPARTGAGSPGAIPRRSRPAQGLHGERAGRRCAGPSQLSQLAGLRVICGRPDCSSAYRLLAAAAVGWPPDCAPDWLAARLAARCRPWPAVLAALTACAGLLAALAAARRCWCRSVGSCRRSSCRSSALLLGLPCVVLLLDMNVSCSVERIAHRVIQGRATQIIDLSVFGRGSG